MTVSHGLGVVEHLLDDDLDDRTAEDLLLALRVLAKTAGVAVRDVVRGVGYEIEARGGTTALPPADTEALVAAIGDTRGWTPYSTLDPLLGFVVCVDGATAGEVLFPDGRETYVSPLAELEARLDALARDGSIDAHDRELFERFRGYAITAKALRMPFVVLGR